MKISFADAENMKVSDAEIYGIKKDIDGFLQWYNNIYKTENED